MFKLRKRTFIIFYLSMMISFNIDAQDFSGHNICIDPGHGPGNSNQGPTGLHEHLINWRVANFLKYYCESAGMDTVLLTRDSLSNPSLSQRENIANNFGSEWFHSVHHNATGWPENNTYRHTLLLYEELANHQPQWPGQSDVMSNYMAQFIYEGLRTSYWIVYGDYSFYGSPSYLGVLNDLQMPGELSEATFHDHPWEEAKMYNLRFNKMEARAIFKALTTYFDAGQISTGCINGIITDAITDDYLNNVTVILNDGQDTTFTDDHNSGFYNFNELPPGNYKVTVTKNGYEEKSDSVEVGAHRFDFLDFEIADVSPPVVLQSTPDSSAGDFAVWDDIVLHFNKPMNPESTNEAVDILPSVNFSLRWSSFNTVLTVDPTGPLNFNENYSLTIGGNAEDAWGHPLDGDGDGIGGDPFTLGFSTQQLTFDRPMVIATEPVEQETDFFPLDVIKIYFNKPMNPQTMTGQKLVIMNSYNIRTQGYGNYVETDSGDYIFNFCPLEPMRENNHHLGTLLYSVQDTAGNQMDDHFRFDFTTSGAPDNFVLCDELSSLENWTISPDSSYIENYGISAADSEGVAGKGFINLNIDFSSGEGNFLLDFENPVIDSLYPPESSEIYGVYLYSVTGPFICQFIFSDDDGLTYIYSDTIDWKGWGLAKTIIPDFFNGGEFSGINLKPLNSTVVHTMISRFFKMTNLSLSAEEINREIAGTFRISSVYPNPFNAETTITLVVDKKQRIRLDVINLNGEIVVTLFDGILKEGDYTFYWDTRNNTLEKVGSGLYFIRMSSKNESKVKKVTLLN